MTNSELSRTGIGIRVSKLVTDSLSSLIFLFFQATIDWGGGDGKMRREREVTESER